jgi:hypothetical protein
VRWGGEALGAWVALPIVWLMVGPGSLANAAQPADPEPIPDFLRPVNLCPQDYEVVVAGLLRDLPSYANLVASRSLGRPAEGAGPTSTVLMASAPDFEPIDLSEQAFGAGLDRTSEIRQVFFTTLERQFLDDQVVSLQQFHWLFLVRGEDGWRVALIYSSLGAFPVGERPPTPPQESSHGIIGQAVRLWLRDCRAGAVFPVSEPTEDSMQP